MTQQVKNAIEIVDEVLRSLDGSSATEVVIQDEAVWEEEEEVEEDRSSATDIILQAEGSEEEEVEEMEEKSNVHLMQ